MQWFITSLIFHCIRIRSMLPLLCPALLLHMHPALFMHPALLLLMHPALLMHMHPALLMHLSQINFGCRLK